MKIDSPTKVAEELLLSVKGECRGEKAFWKNVLGLKKLLLGPLLKFKAGPQESLQGRESTRVDNC